jgi:hypothetical protein
VLETRTSLGRPKEHDGSGGKPSPAKSRTHVRTTRGKLDRRNVTEALSAATEIQVAGLVEALELTLLLADRDPAKYERAALRWHARFMREVPKVEMRESQAILSLLALVPVSRLAAAALAELLARRRGLERACEVLVAWARGA